MRLKNFIGILTCCAVFSIGFMDVKAAAIDKYKEANTTSIGCSANIVKDGVGKPNVNVFSDSYRKQLQCKAHDNLIINNKSTEVLVSNTRKSELNKNITASVEKKLAAKGNVDGVDLSATSSTIAQSSVTSSKVASSAFVYYGYYNCAYELVVNPDDLLPKNLVSNNAYSDTFLESLQELNNSDSYVDYCYFFEKYGTHILSDLLMGEKLDISATYCSESYSFSSSQILELERGLEASIADYKLGGKFLSKISTNSNLDKTVNYYKIEANSIGGAPDKKIQISINEGKYESKSNFSDWSNSCSDYSLSGVVGVGGSGLRPIWEILPQQYSGLSNRMKSMFSEYVKNSVPNDEDIYNSLVTGDIPKQLVRYDSKKITDSGRLNQQVDQIGPGNIDGLLATQKYIDKGFKRCEISVTLEFKIDDWGDQHFYLYKKVPTKSNLNGGLLKSWTRSKNLKEWEKYNFSYVADLDGLKDDSLVLMYSASGTLDDDWYNRHVYVSYRFTK